MLLKEIEAVGAGRRLRCSITNYESAKGRETGTPSGKATFVLMHWKSLRRQHSPSGHRDSAERVPGPCLLRHSRSLKSRLGGLGVTAIAAAPRMPCSTHGPMSPSDAQHGPIQRDRHSGEGFRFDPVEIAVLRPEVPFVCMTAITLGRATRPSAPLGVFVRFNSLSVVRARPVRPENGPIAQLCMDEFSRRMLNLRVFAIHVNFLL